MMGDEAAVSLEPGGYVVAFGLEHTGHSWRPVCIEGALVGMARDEGSLSVTAIRDG